jgi:hypothetical protein
VKRNTLAQSLQNFAGRLRGVGTILHDILILYTVFKTYEEKAMDKPCRYVFRPARPAPAFLRRIWAWL